MVAIVSLDGPGIAYGSNMSVGYRALHEVPARRASPLVEPTLIDLEERTFRFFWDTANPQNGLVPDRYPTPSFSSIAAVGFGLTAYPIGVERGYVTREQARKRVLTTLRFLYNAPQGPHQHGMSGYKGFFYHFLDMKTGERFDDSELSTVDTALLLAGALFCQSYFDGAQPEEVEIRRARRPDLPARRLALGAAAARRPSASAGRPRTASSTTTGAATTRRCSCTCSRSARRRTRSAPMPGAHGRAPTTRRWGKLRAGVPGLRAAVRAPVLARVDRLPRHPGRVHAQARHRLLREHPPRDLRAARLRDRESAALQGLRRQHLGHHGERRPGRLRRSRARPASGVYRAYTARGIGGAAAPRRLHARADGRRRSIPFAPELAIPAVLEMHARFGAVHLRRLTASSMRSIRASRYADEQLQPRPLHSGLRLGRRATTSASTRARSSR